MTAALKVVTSEDNSKKPGRVTNWKTDGRLKHNRKKSRKAKSAFTVRQHIRTKKGPQGRNVFLVIKAPKRNFDTLKNVLFALNCTHRTLDM